MEARGHVGEYPVSALGDPCEAAIVRPGHRPRPRDEIREAWLRERSGARALNEGKKTNCATGCVKPVGYEAAGYR